jgi:hypothetical protein
VRWLLGANFQAGFIRMVREGDKALMIWCRANGKGLFLEILEFIKEGKTEMVIVSEDKTGMGGKVLSGRCKGLST